MKQDVSNIGEREQRRRRLAGLAGLLLTIVLSVAFIISRVEWYWYLVLFIPSLGAMEGALQAQEKTWVLLAARGLRNMDEGEEKIDDQNLVRQLRAKAVGIHKKSIAVAVVFTGLMMLAGRV